MGDVPAETIKKQKGARNEEITGKVSMSDTSYSAGPGNGHPGDGGGGGERRYLHTGAQSCFYPEWVSDDLFISRHKYL